MLSRFSRPRRRQCGIPLSDEQRRWYKTLLEGETGLFGKLATSNATSEKEALDNGRCIAEQGEHEADTGAVSNQQMTKLSNLLMQLRKVCCHPFLFGEDVAAKAIAHHDGNRIEALVVALAAHRVGRDAPEDARGGHAVLIFSQFSMMLDVLEEFCDARGFAHLRLDGSTSLARRRYETALFNKKDGRHFVYLCSTRAGGLGINLQSADTVILADPDWNPTYDQQAMDRAHRLGQQRPVTVIRMCHASSVEEGILAVAARKASLAAAVLAGLEAGADVAALDAANAASGSDPAAAAKLSFGELKEIILAGKGAAEQLPTVDKKDARQELRRTRRLRARPPRARRGGLRKEGTLQLGRRRLHEEEGGGGEERDCRRLGGDCREQAPRARGDGGVRRRGRGARHAGCVSRVHPRGEGGGGPRATCGGGARRGSTGSRGSRVSARDEGCECGGEKSVSRRRRRSGAGTPPSASTAVTAREPCLRCARLVTRPRMGWQCPQHHRKSCN